MAKYRFLHSFGAQHVISFRSLNIRQNLIYSPIRTRSLDNKSWVNRWAPRSATVWRAKVSFLSIFCCSMCCLLLPFWRQRAPFEHIRCRFALLHRLDFFADKINFFWEAALHLGQPAAILTSESKLLQLWLVLLLLLGSRRGNFCWALAPSPVAFPAVRVLPKSNG